MPLRHRARPFGVSILILFALTGCNQSLLSSRNAGLGQEGGGEFPSAPQNLGSGEPSLVPIPLQLRDIPFGGPYLPQPPVAIEPNAAPIVPEQFQPPAVAMVAISSFPGFDFGELEIGKSTVQKFVVANFGRAPALNLSLGLASSRPEFSLTGNFCGPVLGPLASCLVEVRFAPTAQSETLEALRAQYFQASGEPGYAYRPMRGKGIAPATQLAASRYHTCAAIAGAAKCWGYNAYGALGNGSTVAAPAPVDVQGLSDGVSAVAAGEYHACAVVNGAAKCWGYNGYGQLGVGNYTSSSVPVQVAGLETGVTAIAANYHSTCAIQAGALKCWGYNGYGNLGNGSYATAPSPVQVSGLTEGVTGVTMGYISTCAVVGGAAKCWGYNGHGQLGNNTFATNTLPSPVYGLETGVVRVALGNFHACAVLTGGALKCWGYNAYGQLGNNATALSAIPVPVYGIAAGTTNLAVGEYHTCATVGTKLSCWGYNGYGQLGLGSYASSSIPAEVASLDFDAKSLSLGGNHTCAANGGKVKCWGYNGYGQLGNNSTTTSNVPFAIYPGY